MTPSISIIAKLLHVKGMHIEGIEETSELRQKEGQTWEMEKIEVRARPYERLQGRCPNCMQKRPGYDGGRGETTRWRGPNLNGVVTEVKYQPRRVNCPEHGVVTEYVPWQDGRSRSLASFNDEVSYLALTSPKTVVSEFMNINWRTVGNCIKATHDRLEPDPRERFSGMRRICVDETSYEKGHNYITVVYDMERNRVVWIHKGYGLEVFKEFCKLLSEEERAGIEVVAGDGARWIDTCVREYFPNAKRCIDFFHVVSWVNEVLDQTRKDMVRKAYKEFNEAKKQIDDEIEAYERAEKAAKEEYERAKRELQTMARRKGRPSKRRLQFEAVVSAYENTHSTQSRGAKVSSKRQYTVEQISILDALKEQVSQLKGSKYTLARNYEYLAEQQKESKIELIAASYPDLYKAYQFKERLRIILHLEDASLAEEELCKWIDDCRRSGLAAFVSLADKIERHVDNILRAISCHANSARSEATNTTIKAIIKTARGFRNLDNLFALVMLRCSDLVIPLNNRYRLTAEQQARKREQANQRKAERVNAARKAFGFDG